jgi:hypothetical protein
MNKRNLLGVGFFQQTRPELVRVLAVGEDQPPVDGGQSVVDGYLDPLAAPEHSEPECSAVTLNI